MPEDQHPESSPDSRSKVRAQLREMLWSLNSQLQQSSSRFDREQIIVQIRNCERVARLNGFSIDDLFTFEEARRLWNLTSSETWQLALKAGVGELPVSELLPRLQNEAKETATNASEPQTPETATNLNAGDIPSLDTSEQSHQEPTTPVGGKPLVEPAASTGKVSPQLLARGKRCEELAEEIGKIKRYYHDGQSMIEIRTNYSGFSIWNAINPLSSEDRDTFNRPGMWGAASGYANMILGKLYGRSPATVNDWRKNWRDYCRNTPNK